jgi:hypothetical protein
VGGSAAILAGRASTHSGLVKIADSFDCVLHSGRDYATATVTIFSSDGDRVESKPAPSPAR